MCLHEDRKKRIWIGTYAQGVSVLGPNRDVIQHYRHDPDRPGSLPDNTVNLFFTDEAGDIWLGSRAGLHRFHERSDDFESVDFTTGAGLSHAESRVYAIIEDPTQNVMWLGCSGGLVAYDRENSSFQLFQHEPDNANSLSSNEVTVLQTDDEGQLWVGTYKGLNVLRNDGRFDSFSTSDGLPHAAISGLAFDRRGQLWISTTHGLACMTQPGKFENYNYWDGLQSNEFMNRSQYQAQDGAIYFGGVRGYNLFYPSRIEKNPNAPRVAFTALRVFDRSIPLPAPGQAVQLDYRDSFVSIEFTALEFTSAKNNRYRYKLEGFDETWIDAGGRRFASYSNLEGGRYRLYVVGSNNDGVWSDKPARLDIVVEPPFWREAWFLPLILMILVGLTIAAHQLRVRRENLRKVELETLAQSQIDDLQAANQKLIEEARKAGIGEVTTGTLHNLGNILNSLSISTEKLIMLVRNSKAHAMTMANALIEKHRDQLGDFLQSDRRGKRLPAFYGELLRVLDQEVQDVRTEVDSIDEKVRLMQRAVEAELDMAQGLRHVTSISPRDLVLDALRIQAYGLQRAEIDVRHEFQDVPNIVVDQYQILHVLINLIQNAIEAMASGPGVVEHVLEISVRRQATEVEIRVKDNGMGIAEQQLGQLFTYGHTTKASGHGFGLYSCRNSIEDMGGEIFAESEGFGKGSTFVIRIPVEGSGA